MSTLLSASLRHKVYRVKDRIGLEIAWNNKNPFIDRDPNKFWLLFDLRVIDVGNIITRASNLQILFRTLGKKIATKYGASTTHMVKLLPRLEGGGGGGCPILALGITHAKYVEDVLTIPDVESEVDEDDGA